MSDKQKQLDQIIAQIAARPDAKAVVDDLHLFQKMISFAKEIPAKYRDDITQTIVSSEDFIKALLGGKYFPSETLDQSLKEESSGRNISNFITVAANSTIWLKLLFELDKFLLQKAYPESYKQLVEKREKEVDDVVASVGTYTFDRRVSETIADARKAINYELLKLIEDDKLKNDVADKLLNKIDDVSALFERRGNQLRNASFSVLTQLASV